jgi:hypothetical protein
MCECALITFVDCECILNKIYHYFINCTLMYIEGLPE